VRVLPLFRAFAFVAAGFLLMASPTAIEARRAPALNIGTAMIDGRLVRYVIARLDRVRVRAALGGRFVGDTGWLSQIAKRAHAIAAINGGFFEAYKPLWRKNLDQTTVINGSMVFKGDVGSVLFFDRDNHASIEHIPLRIEGFLEGGHAYPDYWYAYWINRLPTADHDTITIFTPAWGASTDLAGGPQVQVENGYVTEINDGPTRIPRDGYVIYFRGELRVAQRFWVGRRASYVVTEENGAPLGSFANAWQAIGGGPELLVDGAILDDPAAQGFRDPKVFRADTRSMVGVSEDQSELIFAVADGTPLQCAQIMKRLGAYDAMGLDGGASSGLWANGRYVVSPGRQINNALVLTR